MVRRGSGLRDRVCGDDDDWAVGVLHDAVGDAAQQQGLDAATPAGAQDDGVGVDLVGGGENGRGHTGAPRFDAWLGCDPAVPEAFGALLCRGPGLLLCRAASLSSTSVTGGA